MGINYPQNTCLSVMIWGATVVLTGHGHTPFNAACGCLLGRYLRHVELTEDARLLLTCFGSNHKRRLKNC